MTPYGQCCICVAFILCIAYAAYYRVKSRKFAVLLLILCGAGLFSCWCRGPMNNTECIFGTTKKINGILYRGCVDVWHILHVLFWTIIGLLYPNEWLYASIISVGWELTEHAMFKGMGMCKDLLCGRIEDVFLNLLGYAIGSYLVNSRNLS